MLSVEHSDVLAIRRDVDRRVVEAVEGAVMLAVRSLEDGGVVIFEASLSGLVVALF